MIATTATLPFAIVVVSLLSSVSHGDELPDFAEATKKSQWERLVKTAQWRGSARDDEYDSSFQHLMYLLYGDCRKSPPRHYGEWTPFEIRACKKLKRSVNRGLRKQRVVVAAYVELRPGKSEDYVSATVFGCFRDRTARLSKSRTQIILDPYVLVAKKPKQWWNHSILAGSYDFFPLERLTISTVKLSEEIAADLAALDYDGDQVPSKRGTAKHCPEGESMEMDFSAGAYVLYQLKSKYKVVAKIQDTRHRIRGVVAEPIAIYIGGHTSYLKFLVPPAKLGIKLKTPAENMEAETE